jgi:hypothetical protein
LRVRLLQSALKALDRVILKEIKLLLEAAAASRANDRFGHTGDVQDLHSQRRLYARNRPLKSEISIYRIE